MEGALPRGAVTPRPLIAAIVDVVAPQPGRAICDPACGTGGSLLAAHDYLAKHHALDRAQKKKLKSGTFFGSELVDSVLTPSLPLSRALALRSAQSISLASRRLGSLKAARATA